MEDKKQDKWYFRGASLVMGFLMVGPLILPLVWFNPAYSYRKKFIFSAVIVVLSLLLFAATAGSLKSLTDYYQQINNIGS